MSHDTPAPFPLYYSKLPRLQVPVKLEVSRSCVTASSPLCQALRSSTSARTYWRSAVRARAQEMACEGHGFKLSTPAYLERKSVDGFTLAYCSPRSASPMKQQGKQCDETICCFVLVWHAMQTKAYPLCSGHGPQVFSQELGTQAGLWFLRVGPAFSTVAA